MKHWQGPAWAAGGAGVLAAALYAAGMLGSGPAPDSESQSQGSAQPVSESVGTVTIDADTQQRLGIVVAPVATGTDGPRLDGFAKGLDAGPLAAIIAEVDTAQAAANASAAEARRLESLYRQDVSASRRSVEAARSQAAADAARIRLAQQRIGIEFGPGLLRLGLAAVRQLTTEIASGRAALIRIDIPGTSLAPGSVVSLGTGSALAVVRVLGPAATADARLQSAGVLAILRGPMAHQSLAGRIMPASVATGTGDAGLIVPRDAIVRFQGQMWVYRQSGKGFVRVVLTDPVSVADGWLIPVGSGQARLKSGDRIAVRGGTGLLAMDLGGTGQNQAAEEE
ncbi:hypothetical protein [Novosphingobium olei]|uniref:Multidrug efflux pump subunit AcrA (Membrane-fusion protein) n=1 Tax=Novosphingobium olei TaxID=2728851 RepID=A0A7Y0BTG5_9SPHN|nr:hypothetical protein [Novosphingobium olei]NML96088.1 hypothetical protein [Novosphingobium olei]